MNQTKDIVLQNDFVHVFKDGRIEYQSRRNRGPTSGGNDYNDLPFTVRPQSRHEAKGYILSYQGETGGGSSESGSGDAKSAWLPEDSLLNVLTMFGSIWETHQTGSTIRT